MIISKPKFSTLFSLLAFVILAYGLALFLFFSTSQEQHPPVWKTILMGIAAGAALAVTYKIFNGYKKLLVSKNRIDVHFAFNLVKKRYYFKELHSWKETAIKTSTGLFKELSLHFGNRKVIKITRQENGNYDKVSAFMRRNFSGKQQK